ncbi:hypothetical protein L198_02148 [Cryptococcus wingfieldii CBS 7118]|uniref:Uncharacterized protein n=1 Tax=Cryptococcus wingfieldii CBS 7118 TaxID=1295528 RepID=A0A1E3JX88_9TREE|nr:hypothetical protein L198_02148 [Cryptococcus wingfieldii CBS 7118]ODO05455.1 hypothetical protein L198_02148 [Cryptococcus wingfieldii CBS 7118]
MSAPLAHAFADLAAPTAPTASTSGFANADPPPPGGLASSPHVPKPGTSIDPATGKPHTAGLTRTELDAKKAAAIQAAAPSAPAEPPVSNSDGLTTSAGLGGEWGPGLASAPGVPKPGKSINPETGKPHTAGITRAELEARKAAKAAELSPSEADHIKSKGADLLDPAPQTEQIRRGSLTAPTTERRPSDVSGREQAARQLLAAQINEAETASPGTSTPGQEMPGAWGDNKPIPLPGTSANAPTTLYEDVAEGLGKVGQAAFAVIPSPIKEAFHQEAMGAPRRVRASATSIIDQARVQATKLSGNLQGTLESTQRRASANFGPDGTIRKQVLNFVDEAFQSTKELSNAEFGFVASGPGGPGGRITSPSRPTSEYLGSVPGEKSDGTGALPGSITETGVAILPEEKNLKNERSTNQNVRPGEASPGNSFYAPVVASSPAGPSDTSTSGPSTSSTLGPKPSGSHTVVNAPTASTSRDAPSIPTSFASNPTDPASHAVPAPTEGAATASKKGETVAPATSASEPSGAGSLGSSEPLESSRAVGHSGLAPALAPALPATILGAGAAHGATALPSSSSEPQHEHTAVSSPALTAPGSSSTLSEDASPISTTTSSIPAGVPQTLHGNDRTTSTSSVTAIAHGREGLPFERSAKAGGIAESPLREGVVAGEEPFSSAGVSNAKSLTPGKEEHGVGHPSSHGIAGAQRDVGKYPAAEHGEAASSSGAAGKSSGTGEKAALGAGAGALTGAAVGAGSGRGEGAGLARSEKEQLGDRARADVPGESNLAGASTSQTTPSSSSAAAAAPTSQSNSHTTGHTTDQVVGIAPGQTRVRTEEEKLADRGKADVPGFTEEEEKANIPGNGRDVLGSKHLSEKPAAAGAVGAGSAVSPASPSTKTAPTTATTSQTTPVKSPTSATTPSSATPTSSSHTRTDSAGSGSGAVSASGTPSKKEKGGLLKKIKSGLKKI